MGERSERTLLTNGRIHRSAHDRDPAQALLMENGRVAWLGERDAAPGADVVLDLAGATVLPGLTDAHVHLLAIAQARLQLSLAAPSIVDLPTALGTVAQQARGRKPGEWVMAGDLDEGRLAERRLPSRRDLDEAAPDNPVVIRRFCGHLAVVNSAALRALGIDDALPDPEGGAFDREGERMQGVARERAAEMIVRAVPPPSRPALAASLREVARHCLGMGITAATEAAVGFTNGYAEEAAVWDLVRGTGGLPLRMGFMLQREPEEAAAEGLVPRPDPMWQSATLKFFADGIVGARTAAMSEPYADDATLGMFMRPEEELERAIVAAHRAGWQVAVHAIGDRAIARVIASFEKAQGLHPRPDPRHRIEHFFCPPPDGLERMRGLGAAVVTQPSFLPRMGASILAALGKRAHRSYPARSVLAAGVLLAGSSDAPTGLVSPWAGMAAAIERRSGEGPGIAPQESLGAREALAMYIAGGASVMRQETWRGRLEPGFAADLVALDRDPFAAPADIAATQVLLTLIGGETVHDRLR